MVVFTRSRAPAPWRRPTPNTPRTLLLRYVAPEILNNEKYGIPVDMWSVGVIIFVIIGGYPPFPQPTGNNMVRWKLRRIGVRRRKGGCLRVRTRVVACLRARARTHFHRPHCV